MAHPRTFLSLLIAFAFALTARAAVASPPVFNLAQSLNNPAAEDGDLFGHSVDLVGDNLLVGAPFTNMGAANSGAAYLFDSSGKLVRTFQQPNPAAGDWFGNEVAAVGDNVLIGDLGDDSAAHDAGTAFLFDGKTGKVLLTLQEPTPHDSDWFGASVAAAGPNLLVGAPLDHVDGVSGGGAYLFDGSTGKLLQSFHKPKPAEGEWFGVSMAAAGDNVLIGAFLDNTGAQGAGAAYLFDGKTGALLHTLQAPKPAENGQFGIAVAAMGSTLIVGAPGANPGQPNAGAVYLFDATTGQWLRTLKAPTPVQDELFGSSVAVAGTNILVGAPGKDPAPAGAAYLFDGQTGALLQRFQNPTPAGGDMFGFWLAGAADRLLIAAPGDHTGSNLGGAAFLYKQ
jgi:outer membrane protein assembly factor BamB